MDTNLKRTEVKEMETRKRIQIKHKWIQGDQIVLRTLLSYGEETRDVTMTFPVEVLKNPDQFRSMLEEAYEQNRPRKNVDLSGVPEFIE